jgi:hypothetical protein
VSDFDGRFQSLFRGFHSLLPPSIPMTDAKNRFVFTQVTGPPLSQRLPIASSTGAPALQYVTFNCYFPAFDAQRRNSEREVQSSPSLGNFHLDRGLCADQQFATLLHLRADTSLENLVLKLRGADGHASNRRSSALCWRTRYIVAKSSRSRTSDTAPGAQQDAETSVTEWS